MSVLDGLSADSEGVSIGLVAKELNARRAPNNKAVRSGGKDSLGG